MNKSELYFSIFLLFLGGFSLYGGKDLSFMMKNGDVGAGFLPLLLAWIIIVFSVFYILKVVMKPSKGKSKLLYSNQIWFGIYLIISYSLINVLGMLTSLGLFIFVVLFILKENNWLKSLTFSIVMILSLYIIFEYLLSANLPRGLLI